MSQPELNQQEIQINHTALYAASKYLGLHCQKQNVAFMRCKAESEDPAHCLQQGQAVTVCAIDVYVIKISNTLI
jgi:NADH dehydrogenase (ubiquinone) 1 alpha subcomplex subunit 8